MMELTHDELQILGLELECIVGVRPAERKRAQRVRLDITLGLDLRKPGRSGRITQTVDYARACAEIVTLLRFRAYRLIETATEEVCAMLFAAHPTLQTVRIHLEKPEALRGRAVTAAVNTSRTRAQFDVKLEEFEGGRCERFLETHEARLELVTLIANAAYTPTETRRVIWLTGGALHGPDATREPGDRLQGEAPFVAGPEGASLFVCAMLGSPS